MYIDETITQFKKELQKNGKIGLLLDIDETLSWTLGHWVVVMQEKFGNPENLSVKELIKKYRYTEHVPYWQTPEAKEWMQQAILDNDLQEALPIIENANHIANKVHKIIPIVGYLTLRPTAVLDGTRQWLKKHGFPDEPLLLRPDNIPHGDGYEWKAHVLVHLYPEVTGIVDDNARMLQYLPDEYKGTIYLYDTESFEGTNLNVIPCKTWDDVYDKVKGQSGL
nr:Unknown Function [uncultured bacterium]